jgi:hypothetical protein
MLISMHCDIDEMAVCAEFHQGPEPVESIWGYGRFRLDSSLQLVVIGVDDGILLPLLVHVTGVPQCTELCSQRFNGLDVREGCTFRHLPCNKSNQDEKPVEVELISLVMRFPAVQF